MFEKIRRWYEQGLWTKTQVHDAVAKPVRKPLLTPEQYKEITGEEYEATA